MALPINHLPCRSDSAAEWLLEMAYCLYHFYGIVRFWNE
jgi:hypothetical protein